MLPAHTYLNGVSLNYVYLLKRVDEDIYYLGFTTDLRRRIYEHNNNLGCKTTRGYSWELVYYESYQTENLARVRELQLKNNRGSKRALYTRLGIKFK